MVKKNWSVPTSPRSPYKIREELQLLAKFENQVWDQKTQAEFGKALARSEEFEGEVPSTPDWVGRARFGTMKFWGFVFRDQNDKLLVTSAGRQLMTGKREDETFAKQLVKWQYPDNQHNGNEYPPTQFALHPFITTLRILKKVKYLSKDEIALFLFTVTKDAQASEVASEIENFRVGLKRHKYRVPRKRFLVQCFNRQILRYYNEELKELLGRMKQKTLFEKDLDKMRVRDRTKLDEFLLRHRKTFYDYADALIRYFRYTLLVSLSGEYAPIIKIAEPAEKKVEAIIAAKTSIHPYDDVNDFYKNFYGSITAVPLPYENVKDLKIITQQWIKRAEQLSSKLKTISPGLIPKVEVPKSLPSDLEKLKDIEENLRSQSTVLNRTLMGFELREKSKMMEIIEDFPVILKGKVIDPPTFLEWNTWRAFESLDVAEEIKPNFKFSDDMQPLCPAGGNMPDLEVYYADFVLIPEVTLKSGAVQWRDEAEPVPVHVIKIKRSVSNKLIFGLFLAPRIDDRTSNVFYGCNSTPDMFGETVCVIPITINQFQDILLSFANHGFSPKKMLSLLTEIDQSRLKFSNLSTDRGVAWVANISEIIVQWKQQLEKA